MRRTFADIKASRIPQALGMCATDSRFITIINEAQERLVHQGNWWGSFARYRCSASDGLLVWPCEIASILSIAVCNIPIKSRDMFFEFVELGMGIQDSTSYAVESLSAVDRGTSPVFKNVVGEKKILVYNDLTDDQNTSVLLLGYDENGNWVRTQQGGVWLDGEVVLSSTLGTASTTLFTIITAVQKPKTNGPIRLYGYDVTTTQQYAMATYQHHETNPNYRVSYIPELDNTASVDKPETVDVVVKLELIPVEKDTDYMLIGCVPALKDMCQAIVAAENEATFDKKYAAIQAGINLAKFSLEAELRHYNGAPQSTMSISGSAGPTNEVVDCFV